MARTRLDRNLNFVAGTIFGLCVGLVLSTWCRNKLLPCMPTFSRSGCCSGALDFIENGNFNGDNQNKESPNSVYIEEADEKGFIFIGIMTAKKYLDSRVVAAYRTWAQSVNGEVMFFSSENSESSYDVPVVSLKNVDDSYPPQKKSFAMLKYMSEHYLDKYEWFMRADDDIFIKGDKLEQFLRSINSSKPQYIGQAGVGTKEEIGLLNLGSTDNYCMGGTGMVFSHETLRLLKPHLKFCVGNLYSTHEDVEIGRCVRKAAGIPCTWAFEMQKYFYQNFKEYKGSFVDTLLDKEVQRAITLHPIKMPTYQYRINNHFTSVKIKEMKQKELELHREITEMNQVLNAKYDFDKYGLKPSVTTFIPQKPSDVIGWEFINSKVVTSHLNVNPRKGLTAYRKETLNEVVAQTMEIINKNSKHRGRTIDYKDVLYGYTNTDPLNGANYILDILLTYRKHKGKNLNVPVRRHAYLHQTFLKTEFIESPWTSEQDNKVTADSPHIFQQLRGSEKNLEKNKLKETVHLILPLAGKVKEFDRFMKIFEEICLAKKDNAQMHIVLFTENSSAKEVEDILNIVGKYQRKYGGHLLEVIETEGDFARAKALDLGAKQCSVDDLIFCVDVDIVLTQDAINRIRLNTIQGVQVYYPIVFSQYDPSVLCGNQSNCKIEMFDFDHRMGYWRQFGFGIAAMYRSDLERVGGYDTGIQGWGKEDVDLFDKVVQSNLTIFRAVDTGMIHAFHPIKCDVNLEPSQFQMCIGSKATCLASQNQLAQMTLKIDKILNRNLDVKV
ncbi:chondroitin sulfate synthase 1-like [Ruditapes philippinarum]|uniref:chondroitin sulfate synthase 1-like n=1 Tax=Ruditapes philippinarum TaxID=129788 RepID=UPI00295AAF26|nr:chondroitin sulfate synthase 1-like [Ruditapes philippinarum]XP_060565019.1 chondroitin sulfate synthase 1-like [Ruditapes philippinarum]